MSKIEVASFSLLLGLTEAHPRIVGVQKQIAEGALDAAETQVAREAVLQDLGAFERLGVAVFAQPLDELCAVQTP